MSRGPWRRPLPPAAPRLWLHVVFTTGPADRVVPTLPRIGEGVAENREPQRGESVTSSEKSEECALRAKLDSTGF